MWEIRYITSLLRNEPNGDIMTGVKTFKLSDDELKARFDDFDEDDSTIDHRDALEILTERANTWASHNRLKITGVSTTVYEFVFGSGSSYPIYTLTISCTNL